MISRYLSQALKRVWGFGETLLCCGRSALVKKDTLSLPSSPRALAGHHLEREPIVGDRDSLGASK
jgi:hypothetical protein